MPESDDQKCRLVTRKMTLDLADRTNSDLAVRASGEAMTRSMSQCDKPECMLIIPLSMLAIPIGSLIVSGSIVAVGNTVHWIEQQGRCDESEVQTALQTLADSLRSLGGIILDTGQNFMRWFEAQIL
ncbi:MAG: hypothetical protein HQM11_01115 [SAR324 cluster bacterium]|nr:hypothetical protein [SAR324 cluster bacterium]